MPIYEYICKKCNFSSEFFQSVNELPPLCPKCGSKLKKLISKSNFHLKGTGWSPDGYSSKGKKK
ncbi:MAG: zinc ribbon domain-containing protein [Candidatus Thorarchaeota archaeon]|jgi:putative FmdB family regulatory protein